MNDVTSRDTEPRRRLGWIDPYVRHHHATSTADRNGTWVFAHDLLEQVARRSDGYAVFHFEDGQHRTTTGIPSTVRRRSAADLPAEILRHDYLFCHQHLAFGGLGRLRASTGARLSICACVTTVDLSLDVYLDTLLFGHAFDAIVISSVAGRTTVETLLADVTDSLAARGFGRRRQAGDGPAIHTIPIGIDTQALIPRDRRHSRQLLRVPDDAIVLVYVGRLTWDDKADLSVLIRLVSRLRQDGIDVHLLVAGQDCDNIWADRLRTAAATAGVGTACTIVPNFPPYLKTYIYSAGDVCVSPSDNIQETFGIALLEAMSCGLPVVASDWSGYRDIVSHGQTGLLIPTHWCQPHVADVSRRAAWQSKAVTRRALSQATSVDFEAFMAATRQLLLDEQCRRRMGEAGRSRAIAHFDWNVIVPKFEEVWRWQWEQLASGQRAEPTRIDLARAFAHFPTRARLECANGGRGHQEVASPLASDCAVTAEKRGTDPVPDIGPLPPPQR
ncbi:MAG: glycosyltransferase family 4 protein [Acidobacteriota bacterium]